VYNDMNYVKKLRANVGFETWILRHTDVTNSAHPVTRYALK